MDTELNGLLAELNRLASDDALEGVSSLLLGNAYTACSKLYEERGAKRITALRSIFPTLHFVIVTTTTLAIRICVAFLLESNQVLLAGVFECHSIAKIVDHVGWNLFGIGHWVCYDLLVGLVQ